MEWYSSSGIEDLSVAKHEEIFDRLPSPVSWSSWSKMVGNFNCSPEELTVLDVEELLFSGTAFSSEVEHLNAASACQGFSHASHQQNAYPCEHSDFQLNDFAVIDDADDIFLYNVPSGLKIFAFMHVHPYSLNISKLHDQGQRNHIQDCANNVESVCPFLQPNDYHQFGWSFASFYGYVVWSSLEPEYEICFSEYSDASEDMSKEEISVEESVYWSYRDQLCRLGEVKAKKSDTNTIDRTVATLLFTFPTASMSNLTEDPSEAKSRLYQPSSPISSVCIVPGGNAEDPTFRSTNEPLPPQQRSCSQFSTAYVMRS
ncbi:UNVERIFIED_CONTAM: hypothetical protein Slati_0312100 [Sesamum latifolium]|uniref:Uncharacterized protein n=1 Tax=Sesamum latifolium TaxID=2727402 RepID=A0AAW2YEY9_9LAMI